MEDVVEPVNFTNCLHSTDNSTAVKKQSKNKRDVLAFLLLGLCNNFCYGIMLSAAFDILAELDKKQASTASPINSTPSLYTNLTTSEPLDYKDCNKVSTGAVLLADIFPSLIAKITAPLYFEYLSYNVMVSVSISLGAVSLVIVSFSQSLALSLFGVGCASAGTGVGEFVFLSLSSYFDKSVMVGYSTGTGVSGVLFALAYVLLTSVLGISARVSMLIVLAIPASSFIVYFFLLTYRPEKKKFKQPKNEVNEAIIDNTTNSQDSVMPVNSSNDYLIDNNSLENDSLISNNAQILSSNRKLTPKEKLRQIPPLLKYMIPLGTVYMAEYLINQGIVELIYFPTLSWLNHDDQYTWYQLIYQIGVFISRSSIALFTIKQLWVFSVLQWSSFVFLLTVAIYHYIPSIWIIFAVIMFEGLLGGFSFANTFYRILIEVKEEYKEFAMGMTSIAISFGITISGLVSIPLHNAICNSNK